MLKNITASLIFLLGFALLITAGCSKSDDQRDFENQALTAPNGITETNSSGEITGNTDESDWQISPMYRGLIELNSELAPPPHPNPMHYNGDITIQIYFRVEEPVDNITVRKFRLPSDSQYPQLRFFQQDELSTFNTITIQGQEIASGEGSGAEEIYRLLIYDGNQNMISFGDVRIQ